MADKLETLKDITLTGQEVFYTTDFMLVLEAHLPYLKKDATIQPVDLTTSVKFVGNFTGLLINLGFSLDHCWLVQRLNGLRSSDDFDGKLTELLVPNAESLNKVLELHMPIQKML